MRQLIKLVISVLLVLGITSFIWFDFGLWTLLERREDSQQIIYFSKFFCFSAYILFLNYLVKRKKLLESERSKIDIKGIVILHDADTAIWVFVSLLLMVPGPVSNVMGILLALPPFREFAIKLINKYAEKCELKDNKSF